MDIIISRVMIEHRLRIAKDRLAHQTRENEIARSEGNVLRAEWFDGASFSTRREIDTLEILIEMSDDMANNVYSIAQ